MATVAIVGGGPAGLMAAEVLAAGMVEVELFDAMPSLGRKFLLAGKGGLNLTHNEPFEQFIGRYAERSVWVKAWLDEFAPSALRAWAHGLGVTTFVGSSDRVFPTDMKAAPLLRAGLRRLRAAGVRFHTRHHWLGWSPEDAPTTLRFVTPDGEVRRECDAVILALGGASWKKLGSDGAWVPWLEQRAVEVAPLVPANCGFDAAWSDYFAQHFAGQPVKSVILTFTDARGRRFERAGEFTITSTGVEGSLIYAASNLLRDEIFARGRATPLIDLVPGRSAERIAGELASTSRTRSWPEQLRSGAGISGVKTALLRESMTSEALRSLLANDPRGLAERLKAWPLVLTAPSPIDEVISSAGGVREAALDENLMLRQCPGVFCAGEMLDWEAPTGGYLLTACFASGRAAGRGALIWLRVGHV